MRSEDIIDDENTSSPYKKQKSQRTPKRINDGKQKKYTYDQKTGVKADYYEHDNINSEQNLDAKKSEHDNEDKSNDLRKRTNDKTVDPDEIRQNFDNSYDQGSIDTASDDGFRKYARYEGYLPYTSELMSTIPKTKLPSLYFAESNEINTLINSMQQLLAVENMLVLSISSLLSFVANDKFKNVESYVQIILFLVFIILTVIGDIVALGKVGTCETWTFQIIRVFLDLFVIFQSPIATSIYSDCSFLIFWGLTMFTTIIGVLLNAMDQKSLAKTIGVYCLNLFMAFGIVIIFNIIVKTTTQGLVVIYYLNAIWMFRIYFQTYMIKNEQKLKSRSYKEKLIPLVVTPLFIMKFLETKQFHKEKAKSNSSKR